MSDLNKLMNETEDVRRTVFVVQEEVDDATNILYIFSSLDSAKNFVLRKIGEFKDNFVSSSRRLSVESDEYNYYIKVQMWYFYMFYYEKTVRSFHIEEQVVHP